MIYNLVFLKTVLFWLAKTFVLSNINAHYIRRDLHLNMQKKCVCFSTPLNVKLDKPEHQLKLDPLKSTTDNIFFLRVLERSQQKTATQRSSI